MKQWVIRLCKPVLAWAISLAWKYEGPRMLSGSVTISGHEVPLVTLATVAGVVVPALVRDLKSKKDAHQIVHDLEQEAGPVALAAAEAIANILYPGAGTIIEIVAYLLEHHHQVPFTQEEENRWMDRFGAGSVS